jgi:KaiC/GvpD/RAD55 family RecA-like ATPase
MRIELTPSGVDGVDNALGGIPAKGTTFVYGPPKSGKTVFSLQVARAAIARGGKVAIVTNDAPEAVIELSTALLGWDLRASIRAGEVTILRYAPRFESDLEGAEGASAPLAELAAFVKARGVTTLVIDSLDPIIGAVGAATAKPFVRALIGALDRTGLMVVVTAHHDPRERSAPVRELLAQAAGALGLGHDDHGRLLRIDHVSWASVRGVETRIDFVEGTGIVARGDLAPVSARMPRSPQLARAISYDDFPAVGDEVSTTRPVRGGSSRPPREAKPTVRGFAAPVDSERLEVGPETVRGIATPRPYVAPAAARTSSKA